MNATRILLCVLLSPFVAHDVLADERVPDAVRGFVQKNCLDCHSGAEAEGGLDLEALGGLDSEESFEHWVRVHDRVVSGEMPPADASTVTDEARQAFHTASARWMTEHEREAWKVAGRVRSRRLTNLQLERTLHDLLGVDVPLAARLPAETRAASFSTVANRQSMSHFQLERHVGLVDVALDEAYRRVFSSTSLLDRTFDAKGVARRNPSRRCREPELIGERAVVWSGGVTFYGRLPVTTAREDGWYRFTLRASALNPPEGHGVWCTVRSGKCVSSAPHLAWVTAVEVREEEAEWTFEAWLPKGHMLEIRPGDATLKQARFAGGQVGTGEGGPQNVPGVGIHSLRIQRVHRGPDDGGVRKLLFGDLEVSTGKQPEVVSKNPRADAVRLMTAFAERAYRRPVDVSEIRSYVDFVQGRLEAGTPLAEALRSGYRALLCSPRFLYLVEKPGRLDDHAVACRLSYFLWNTMPDAELRSLADAGRLRDEGVLAGQVERMLSDDRGRRFVEDFAAEWLDLDQIDFTVPDRRMFRDFDPVVQNSMLDETHHFLAELLRHDRSVAELIDSDYTFLNERLARYYGIDGVAGDDVRRVTLRPEHRRGGVLTQGAVLKVTANGTTTSPVVRGVWVSERLLGTPIPDPPDNVPAIEPDVRGAKSIREMLAKHRSDSSCASCHVKIDPPGFALENYDPAGRWRERYGSPRGGGKRVPVDSSYELDDGRTFADVDGFRELVLADPDRVARCVAEKLLTYGTGGPVSFADRAAVDDVVRAAAERDYGFRSLVKAVATSDVFLTK